MIIYNFTDSLDILISTLDQATFDQGHIQGLFFLAETALYWLRTDAINSPYLRISEIKLLRVSVILVIMYRFFITVQLDKKFDPVGLN